MTALWKQTREQVEEMSVAAASLAASEASLEETKLGEELTDEDMMVVTGGITLKAILFLAERGYTVRSQER